jgi:hypothetical protein
MLANGFLRPSNRELLINAANITDLLATLLATKLEPNDTWFRDRDLS